MGAWGTFEVPRMNTTATKPPRLDVELLLLVAMMLAAGVAFFAACTEAHAGPIKFDSSGSTLASPTLTFANSGTRTATLWISGDELHFTGPGGDYILGSSSNSNEGLDVEDQRLLIMTLNDLAHLLRDQPATAAAPPLGEELLVAIAGVMFGIFVCAVALKRYAVVGLRARRWASRAHRAVEQRLIDANRAARL